MSITGWLLSTRAQNIPFKCAWLLKRVVFLSIFTLEHILCLLLSLIYPAVYLLYKELCELSVSRYSIWVMPKRWYFSWKRRVVIFVYVLEYMLTSTLVSLDKMQNIITLMRKSSKSEDRAFWKLLASETGLSPPVKYFYWPFQGGTSLVDHLCYFCAFASAHCCLVVPCCERADLLALVCGVNLWDSYCPIWYAVSGVVLDCFDSWSVPPFLVSDCTHSTSYIGCFGPVTGS